jgi:amino acid permease
MGLWCLVIFAAANCLIEITTLYPVDGGFIRYAERFVDKSFGTAIGWNVGLDHTHGCTCSYESSLSPTWE